MPSSTSPAHPMPTPAATSAAAGTTVTIERSVFGATAQGEVVHRYAFLLAEPTQQPQQPSQPPRRVAAEVVSFGAAILRLCVPSTGSHAPHSSSANTANNKYTYMYQGTPNTNTAATTTPTPTPTPTPSAAAAEVLPTIGPNIVAGPADVAGLEVPGKFFGLTVGRVCNRIRNGAFTLDQPVAAATLPLSPSQRQGSHSSGAGGGTERVPYALPLNNGPNHLHGGPVGLHHRVWRCDVAESMESLVRLMDEGGYHLPTVAAAASTSTTTSTADPSLAPITFPALVCHVHSADGSEGYPGDLSVGCIYSLTTLKGRRSLAPAWSSQGSSDTGRIGSSDSGGQAWTNTGAVRLRIDYFARLTGGQGGPSTVVNLTNHAFFHLCAPNTAEGAMPTAGSGGGDGDDATVGRHLLHLHAAHFTPIDATLVPTGAIAPVSDTPAFDFLGDVPVTAEAVAVGRPIDSRIGAPDGSCGEQLRNAGGYDHNWCLSPPAPTPASSPPDASPPIGRGALSAAGTGRGSPPLPPCAHLVHPLARRYLRVETTQPGVQFYGGNFLNGTVACKSGRMLTHRAALCLETQGYPDAPNQPSFPSVVLHPHDTYHHTTILEAGTF